LQNAFDDRDVDDDHVTVTVLPDTPSLPMSAHLILIPFLRHHDSGLLNDIMIANPLGSLSNRIHDYAHPSADRDENSESV
jgi:hypothetical protein